LFNAGFIENGPNSSGLGAGVCVEAGSCNIILGRSGRAVIPVPMVLNGPARFYHHSCGEPALEGSEIT
jgi:hypothetical protein